MDNDFCQKCRCKPCKCDDPNHEFYMGADQTNETDYDRIMKKGEDEYLRLKKEGDPYAFYRAVEIVNRDLAGGEKYAFKDIADYEEITRAETNEDFKIGWDMARTKNKHVGISE